ncbi:TPA: O-antigen ligase family protein [Citrobacter sedlakii]
MTIFCLVFSTFTIDVAYTIIAGVDYAYPIYKLHIICIIFILYYLSFSDKRFHLNISKLLKNATIGMFIICFYQQMVAMHLLPTISFMPVRYIYENLSLITGGFGNPNNQAVLSLLVALSYALLLKNRRAPVKYFPIVYLLNFFIVVVTTSRTVLVLYVLLSFFFILSLKFKYKSSIILAIIAFIILGFIFIKPDANDLFVSRMLMKISTITTSGDSDESLGVRGAAYLYFIKNFIFYPIGFGPGNYGDFYEKSTFFVDNPYFAESPHSFIFEIYLAYGAISIVGLIMLILIAIHTQLTIRWTMFFYSIFIICSFVPSSILKMPCVFFLLLLPIVINQRREYENSHRLFKHN